MNLTTFFFHSGDVHASGHGWWAAEPLEVDRNLIEGDFLSRCPFSRCWSSSLQTAYFAQPNLLSMSSAKRRVVSNSIFTLSVPRTAIVYAIFALQFSTRSYYRLLTKSKSSGKRSRKMLNETAMTKLSEFILKAKVWLQNRRSTSLYGFDCNDFYHSVLQALNLRFKWLKKLCLVIKFTKMA